MDRRSIYDKMPMDQATKLSEALKRYGISAIDNNGVCKSLFDVLSELQAVYVRMDQEEKFKNMLDCKEIKP